ncbi:MAG: VCBS repeat-containing protein, partial [Fuerstia sp.]|nr:VCBS repeat-containing protein [Fuerstiella sp.]
MNVGTGRMFIRPRLLHGVILVPILMAMALAVWFLIPGPTAAQLLANARFADGKGREKEALAFALRSLEEDPANSEARLLAGELSARAGDHASVAGLLTHPEFTNADCHSRDRLRAATLLRKAGAISAAESILRSIIRDAPEHSEAVAQLTGLLLSTGRRWEGHQLLRLRLQTADPTSSKMSFNDLILLGDSELIFDDRSLINQALRYDPESPEAQLGNARIQFSYSRFDEARRAAETAIKGRPDLSEAFVLLGRILLELDDQAALELWCRGMRASAEEIPDFWAVRAELSERAGKTEAARRCWWECLHRNPDHRLAAYRLALSLPAGKFETERALLFERSHNLELLSQTIQALLKGERGLEAMIEASNLCKTLNRPLESHFWISLNDGYRQTGVASQRRSYPPVGRPDEFRSEQSALPAKLAAMDLSSIPLPELSEWHQAAELTPGFANAAPLSFEDISEAAGIDFQYSNGGNFQTGGVELHQTLGGGVGVIDIDADNLPDLFFVQSRELENRHLAGHSLGQIYRNLGDERFGNVSETAGPFDTSFGQGVAVGDIDCDGFSDLYIAAAGRNRLFLNHGDGTFEASTLAGLDGDSWTSSCLIADLNGDALPDLFDVNYLEGREPFLHRCRTSTGERVVCKPNQFAAAQDALLLNSGDGSFQDISALCGIEAPDGKGLGVVTIVNSETGRIDLFVANDTTENFLFVNSGNSDSGMPVFREEGLFRGVAANAYGIRQACMGISTGDVDGNGLQDLFVTNFYNDTNTLYCQTSAGQFTDSTRTSRLADPSLLMLGFGTQCLDVNRDSWPDIVVTNGHIDNFSDDGTPWKMRSQLFVNQGGGIFLEHLPEHSSDWFGLETLGRALARVDLNADGLDDFVVTHLDRRPSLMVNRSTSSLPPTAAF